MSATTGSPRARALAAALREARTESGVGQRVVARKLGISQGTISYWENGGRVPRVEDISGYLTVLGVTNDDKERILDIAREANQSSWLAAGRPGVTNGLAGVLECERTAARIIEWTPLVVPGLLQTSEYTRALIARDDIPDAEHGALLRAGRRDVVTKSRGTPMTALIGESALHARIGGTEVQLDQLRYLLKLNEELENLDIQIIRTEQDWHPGSVGPFVLYVFSESPPIVHLEHYRASAFLYDEDDLAAYQEAAETLRTEVAMNPEDSTRLIAEVINQQETTA